MGADEQSVKTITQRFLIMEADEQSVKPITKIPLVDVTPG